MWDSIKDFFANIWYGIVNIWEAYQEFIYGIFPGQMGDLISFVILAIVIILIVKSLSFGAFKK